ncbi:MAG TPA: preprotein translocase subunit SecG, partial [Polyangiales bacterium]|nr:preprotein translocase subunit SecG [Polyangiales bacterium]
MYTFLSILYVLVCLFLILVVLLQPGRGGVGGAFGGGSSQTVFGGSGAGNFLTRLTSISAALFMILSATLAYMSSSSDKSLEAAT